jgi:hypothetical protein
MRESMSENEVGRMREWGREDERERGERLRERRGGRMREGVLARVGGRI